MNLNTKELFFRDKYSHGHTKSCTLDAILSPTSTVFYVHTYIIGHYNSSARITAQFLIPLMLCALFLYINCGIYSLKVIFEQQIFDKLFRGRFIYLLSGILQKSAQSKSLKKYFFHTNPGFISNKSYKITTVFRLDHGLFISNDSIVVDNFLNSLLTHSLPILNYMKSLPLPFIY